MYIMLSATFSQLSAAILLGTQILHAAASYPLNLVAQRPSPNLNATEAKCEGSFWCPTHDFASNRINIYLQNWIKYTMHDSDVYGPGVQIACATVTILLPPLGTNAYCAYTKGIHVPEAGINGSLIKRRMEDLRTRGCFACGKTAVADNGNLNDEGVFVIDYVPKSKVRCGRPGDVVCPPTVPSLDHAGLEEGPRPELSTFNATFDDGAVTLQALNVQGP